MKTNNLLQWLNLVAFVTITIITAVSITSAQSGKKQNMLRETVDNAPNTLTLTADTGSVKNYLRPGGKVYHAR